VNATNARLHWELTKIWDVMNHDPKVRIIVVTGAGDRAFSAGGNLSWISETAGHPDRVAENLKKAGDIVFNMRPARSRSFQRSTAWQWERDLPSL